MDNHKEFLKTTINIAVDGLDSGLDKSSKTFIAERSFSKCLALDALVQRVNGGGNHRLRSTQVICKIVLEEFERYVKRHSEND